MKELAATFFALPASKRKSVIIELCSRALQVWEEHFPAGTAHTYQESVVGTTQILDTRLPREALLSVQASTSGLRIAGRYLEPIVALQDNDLQLPDAAEFSYYAIYNAFRLYVSNEPIEEKLILSQALSALPDSEARGALSRALAHAA